MATAYCLRSHTTSGPRPQEIPGGCIALSRPLARSLNLYRGPGQYAYCFGAIVEVTGVGRFVFADLMPRKWTGYRVDIWRPSLQACKAFGVQRTQIRVVKPGD